MVESTALEMRRAGNRTVGSNPTLSATYKSLIWHYFSELQMSRGSAPLLPVIGTGERRGMATTSPECRMILPGGIGQYRFSPRREVRSARILESEKRTMRSVMLLGH